MNRNQRNNYVQKIKDSLSSIGSQDFTFLAQIILQEKYKLQFELRGQTVSGEPVGHSLDANSLDRSIVSEFGKERGYFLDKHNSKIIGDIEHAKKLAPQSERIVLMSTQVCGPKKYTELQSYLTTIEKASKKNIDLIDGRKIAEFIVDDILLNLKPDVIGRLTELVPGLEQIHNENIFTNTFPILKTKNFKRLKDECEIMKKLDEFKSVQLFGISGIGKTYLSLSVAQSIANTNEDWLKIWIPGHSISNSSDLNGIQIEGYGVRQNVIGLMQRFNCILIIDGLEKDIEEVINKIVTEVKGEYRLIVTSQTIADVTSTYPVKFVDEEIGMEILNQNIESVCPTEIYDQIVKAFGAHPFLLNQISILIKSDELTWEAIPKELDYITESEDEKKQVFYNRLFKNHIASLVKELRILKWANSKELEYSFLKNMIGHTGIKKLKARDFFNIYNKTIYTLHDIVFKSLVQSEIVVNDNSFKNKFQEILENAYNSFNPDYYRIIHIHKDLIESILRAGYQEGIYSYSYLLACNLDTFEEGLVGKYENKLLKNLFEKYNPKQYFTLMSWIEMTEIKYRVFKRQDREKAIGFLEKVVAELSEYLTAENNLPKSVLMDVMNHFGKFQRNIGQDQAAIETFERLLKLDSRFCAAKFHLAKLLRRVDKPRAILYLTEIINDYGKDQEVSPTIVLASFKEFKLYKEFDDLFLNKFIDDFRDLISQTMVSKFDLPYEVLGALSSKIGFNYPEKIIQFAESLPIPSENSLENNTLFDVGQIYYNTAKAYNELGNITKGAEYADQSLAFYFKLKKPTDFHLRFIAESYLLKGEAKFAVEHLDKSTQSSELWSSYTRAKAQRMTYEYDEALATINHCLQLVQKPTTVFLRERALIKIEMKDKTYKDDYQLALKHSDEGKFRQMIISEIEALSTST